MSRSFPESGACPWFSHVELFAGVRGNGGAYTATVYEDNTQLMTSTGDKVPDHGWVRFDQ
jgi:hypothetical protein